MFLPGSRSAGAWLHCCLHCRRLAEFSLAHGAAVGLTWFVVYPLQGVVLGADLDEASLLMPALLFLPTIVKTLAAWMYGWWAVLYILPTAIAQHLLLGLSLDGSDLVVLFLYLAVVPLVKSWLEQLGLDFSASRHLHTWRSLMMIMVASSAVLAGTFVVLHRPDSSLVEAILFVSLCITGDIMGAAFVMLSFLALFRAKERFDARFAG